MSGETITPSDGNIFQDLGFPPEEAENLKIRSYLMATIRQVIEERGLTQMEAGRLFGVAQPRISNVVTGQIDEFTIDSLVNMLSQAGLKVKLSVGSPV